MFVDISVGRYLSYLRNKSQRISLSALYISRKIFETFDLTRQFSYYKRTVVTAVKMNRLCFNCYFHNFKFLVRNNSFQSVSVVKNRARRPREESSS